MNHANMYESSVNFGSNDFSWLDDMEKGVNARYDPKNIINCQHCYKAGCPVVFNNNEELSQHEKICPILIAQNKKPLVAPKQIKCPVPGCVKEFMYYPNDEKKNNNFRVHHNTCKNAYESNAKKNIDKINELLKTIPKHMLDQIIMPSKD